MFNWKEVVLSLSIFIAIVAVIGIGLQSKTPIVSSEIEYLEKSNDSILEEVKEIDQQLLQNQQRSDSLYQSSEQIKKYVEEIETRKDEKILHMYSTTDMGLYEFFANFNSQDSISN